MKKLLVSIFLLTLIICSFLGTVSFAPTVEAAGPAPSQWPMFQGDAQHTGQSPYNTAHVDGTLKWAFASEMGFSSDPSIGPDGTIYIGGDDHELYAIGSNGVLKWTFEADGFIFSTPAITDDEAIIFCSGGGNVTALNQDGSVRWIYQVGDMLTESPTIADDGTIYVNDYDGTLYALDSSGNLKWSEYTDSLTFNAPAIGFDGIVYLSSTDQLSAIYPNGTLKWTFDPAIPENMFTNIETTPSISADGTIYFCTNGGWLTAVNPDGTRKWYKDIEDDAEITPSIRDDGVVIVRNGEGTLYAIRPDGSQLWKRTFDAGLSSETGEVVISADHYIVFV